MPNTRTVMDMGQTLIDHCNRGEETALMQTYYSPDAVSVEAVEMPGMGREAKGLEAIMAKGEWWVNANEVHSQKLEGPFVHGDDRFSVIFDIDVTEKATGNRTQMREIATYYVENDKIIREEFAYPLGS
ncbi:MAG: nuclear transport factor 2 family protein [Pseudomonadota bacterium]